MSDPLPLLCCGPTPALQRNLVFPGWESPGDVVRTRDVSWSVGGKATNAARAVTRAGGTATLLGFAGGANGDRMRELLQAEGLKGTWVETACETRICQTLLDGNGHRIRELVEDALPVSDAEWQSLHRMTAEVIHRHGALLLCGSLPQDAPENTYATLVSCARKANRMVILDVKGSPLVRALSHRPDLVKINREELSQTTGENDIATGIRQLLAGGVRMVLITDGPGSAWLGAGDRVVQFELPRIEAVNPIGGGDTVTGVTALALVRGDQPEAAARLGLAAGLAQTLTSHPAEFDPADMSRLARDIVERQ